MTDRVLSMLYQYLLSNQALELNDTFQIYCKILSVDHSAFKTTRKNPSRKRKNVTNVHVGNSEHLYKYKWAIDVPSIQPFTNLCLLICTIFGLLQHLFFDSNQKNKSFIYAQRINDKNVQKKSRAQRLLLDQLDQLFAVTDLKKTGPYQLKATVILLSQTYKCQFFIFNSVNNVSKMFYMYPKEYDDSLKPIFLYKPKFDCNHLIFIRNLNSFFFGKSFTCLACHKSFKRNRDARASHLCRKKSSCFACRRFYASKTTYLNKTIIAEFCDKYITTESQFSCPTCNCDIYSQLCLKNHKRFCRGKGFFGYKCSHCKHFTYCTSKLNSNDLKVSHSCSDQRICRFCFEKKDLDHLCKLRNEKLTTYHTRLAFFNLIFEQNSRITFGLIALREENERGSFKNYRFFEPYFPCTDLPFEPFKFNYFDLHSNFTNTAYKPTVTKMNLKNNFYLQIQRNLGQPFSTLEDQMLDFFLDPSFENTTYICEDSTSEVMVRKPHYKFCTLN